MKCTIYHNPRCSKSREALQYLKAQGAEIEVVEYLKDTPTEKEIKSLLKKLNVKATDILRKNEPLYKEHYKDKIFSESEWIKILSENPVLIQRPIIVKGDQAVVGRSEEQLHELDE